MSNYTPKPPSPSILGWIDKTYHVDVEQGVVLNLTTGKNVGFKDRDGYISIDCWLPSGERRRIKRAHLVWYKHYGTWPDSQIDHRDRNPAHDSIGNLRKATKILNATNRRSSSLRSLPTGVVYNSRLHKPYVAIRAGQFLGSFETPELASMRYQEEVSKVIARESTQ